MNSICELYFVRFTHTIIILTAISMKKKKQTNNNGNNWKWTAISMYYNYKYVSNYAEFYTRQPTKNWIFWKYASEQIECFHCSDYIALIIKYLSTVRCTNEIQMENINMRAKTGKQAWIKAKKTALWKSKYGNLKRQFDLCLWWASMELNVSE